MTRTCSLPILVIVLAGILCLLVPVQAREETFGIQRSRQVQHDFDRTNLSGNRFVVDIIAGTISVTGHASSDIHAEIAILLEGKTESDLVQAEEELQLIVEPIADGLLIFLDTPFRDRSVGYFDRSRNYRYRCDVVLQVPHDMILDLKTVITGDIRLSGINGDIQIENVTGNILLDNVVAGGAVKTVSGDIYLDYQKVPDLDLVLHSRFGEVYSGVDFQSLPTESLAVEKHGDMTRYYKDPHARIRLARGGRSMQVESLSGDILIQNTIN